MTRIRTKICGITRLEDALAAVELGADALGFVFYPGSPRYLSPAQAQAIIARLPAFVTAVALFMDADAVFVRDILKHVQVDLLQFHGKESPEFCRQFQRPYIKAVPMREPIDIPAYCASFSDSRGVLLDSTQFGVAGGTGETFDWATIPDVEQPVIMAGGIKPENVAEAIRASQCYGIDVSSGVENAPGRKDRYKMSQLFAAIAAVSHE